MTKRKKRQEEEYRLQMEKEREEEEKNREPLHEEKDPMELIDEIFDKNVRGLQKQKQSSNIKEISLKPKYRRRKKPQAELQLPQDPYEHLIKPFPEEIGEFPNAEFYLQNIVLDLKINDWMLQFEAINNLRSVNYYNLELLYGQDFNMHLLIQVMMVVLKNSQQPVLTRNIVIALRELVDHIKKIADYDLEEVLEAVIERASLHETTPRELNDIKECLAAIFINCSEDRIISRISRLAFNKNLFNKTIIPLCLETIISKRGKSMLDIPGVGKLLTLLVSDMSHVEWDVRRVARRAFYKLIESGVERKLLENFFREVLDPAAFDRFNEFMQRTDKIRVERFKLPNEYSPDKRKKKLNKKGKKKGAGPDSDEEEEEGTAEIGTDRNARAYINKIEQQNVPKEDLKQDLKKDLKQDPKEENSDQAGESPGVRFM